MYYTIQFSTFLLVDVLLDYTDKKFNNSLNKNNQVCSTYMFSLFPGILCILLNQKKKSKILDVKNPKHNIKKAIEIKLQYDISQLRQHLKTTI